MSKYETNEGWLKIVTQYWLYFNTDNLNVDNKD